MSRVEIALSDMDDELLAYPPSVVLLGTYLGLAHVGVGPSGRGQRVGLLQQGLEVRSLPPESDPVMRRLQHPMTVRELRDALRELFPAGDGPDVNDFFADGLIEVISSRQPLEDWDAVRLIPAGRSDGMVGTEYWKLANDALGRSTTVRPGLFWVWTFAPFNRSLEAAVQAAATSVGLDVDEVRQAVALDLQTLLALGLARLDVAPRPSRAVPTPG